LVANRQQRENSAISWRFLRRPGQSTGARGDTIRVLAPLRAQHEDLHRHVKALVTALGAGAFEDLPGEDLKGAPGAG
jgi:hypothetical protein